MPSHWKEQLKRAQKVPSKIEVNVTMPPLGFTGLGEDGQLQTDRPTHMVQTDRGPVTIHEGEKAGVDSQGRLIVIPASKLGGQKNLKRIEEETGMEGFQEGTSMVFPNLSGMSSNIAPAPVPTQQFGAKIKPGDVTLSGTGQTVTNQIQQPSIETPGRTQLGVLPSQFDERGTPINPPPPAPPTTPTVPEGTTFLGMLPNQGPQTPPSMELPNLLGASENVAQPVTSGPTTGATPQAGARIDPGKTTLGGVGQTVTGQIQQPPDRVNVVDRDFFAPESPLRPQEGALIEPGDVTLSGVGETLTTEGTTPGVGPQPIDLPPEPTTPPEVREPIEVEGESDEDRARRLGLLGLERRAAGVSPADRTLANIALGQLGGETEVARTRRAQELAQTGVTGTRAASALAQAERGFGARRAELGAGLALGAQQRAAQAERDLAIQGLAGQRFESIEDQQQFSNLVDIGDYNGAADFMERTTGVRPDVGRLQKTAELTDRINNFRVRGLTGTALADVYELNPDGWWGENQLHGDAMREHWDSNFPDRAGEYGEDFAKWADEQEGILKNPANRTTLGTLRRELQTDVDAGNIAQDDMDAILDYAIAVQSGRIDENGNVIPTVSEWEEQVRTDREGAWADFNSTQINVDPDKQVTRERWEDELGTPSNYKSSMAPGAKDPDVPSANWDEFKLTATNEGVTPVRDDFNRVETFLGRTPSVDEYAALTSTDVGNNILNNNLGSIDFQDIGTVQSIYNQMGSEWKSENPWADIVTKIDPDRGEALAALNNRDFSETPKLSSGFHVWTTGNKADPSRRWVMTNDVDAQLNRIGKDNHVMVDGNIYKLLSWNNNWGEASLNSVPTVTLYDPRTGENFMIKSGGPNAVINPFESIKGHDQMVGESDEFVWDIKGA